MDFFFSLPDFIVLALLIWIPFALARIRGQVEQLRSQVAKEGKRSYSLWQSLQLDLTQMLRRLETPVPSAADVAESPQQGAAAAETAPPPLTAEIVSPPPPRLEIPAPPPEPPRARAAAAVEPEAVDIWREKPKPRTKSPLELATLDVLRRCWNWIVVGEEHRPAGVSMEFAVATTWLVRAGVVILVTGIGFFVKYSVERGYLGPHARVALTAATGLALLVGGSYLLGRRYHVLGQGLMGGGIATLYFAAFAAASFYHLLPTPAAFGLMALITVLAGGVAVRFNSALMAVLGILGGYGTPVMLSTGEVNFPGLYGYLLVLGAGVLAVSIWKNWRLLNLLSFLGAYALVFASLSDAYTVDYFWQVVPFLAAFFILFSTIAFLFNLLHRNKSSLWEILILWANAATFFALGYSLVDEALGKNYAAVITLGLSIFYTAHVYYFLIRRLVDRALFLSFISLAAFFLAITVPLVLSSDWITASWAVQALILLWIAGKLDSIFLRNVAFLLYGITLFRLGAIDLPRRFGFQGGEAEALLLTDYFRQLTERLVGIGVPIASLALAARLVKQPLRKAGAAIGPENDMADSIPPRTALQLFVAAALIALFVFLHLEVNRTVGYLFAPLRLPALTLLWVATCGVVLAFYLSRSSRWLSISLVLCAAAIVIKALLIDLPSWPVVIPILGGREYYFLDALMRLVDFGSIVAFFAAVGVLLAGKPFARSERALFAGTSLALAFLFLTLELNAFLFHFLPGMRSGGTSILWALFAIGCLFKGILGRIRELRYVGLGLFGVAAGKIFFVDLMHLDQLYRIVAFLILGVIVLCGSAAYLRYQSAFAVDRKNDDGPGEDAGDKERSP